MNSDSLVPKPPSNPSTLYNDTQAQQINGLSLQPFIKAPITLKSLHIPPARRGRSQSPHGSLISADDFSELRRIHSTVSEHESLALPVTPPKESPSGWRGKIHGSWVRNKGLALVLLAQVFGVGMNIGTRLLENLGETAGASGGGMHPFQILFARMSITTTLSVLYMWYTNTPDWPFGKKELRGILVARGLGGFWGVFGLYYSLQYLPIADATVLTFIAPFIACAVCAKLLHEPFTRVDKIGGLVSLVGVILIARPTSLFPSHSNENSELEQSQTNVTESALVETGFATAPEATEAQRLTAIGMAMLGVCGAAVAYVTIRWIGNRAHPLISVNYFATWCTIVSFVALAFVPGIPFVFPHNLKEWGLLALIGIGGFAMQFLLTAGLRYEKSSRATNMVYTSMLFALGADRIIWGAVPSMWSLGGSALILGSAIVVAIQKESGGASKGKASEREAARIDEEAALVEGVDGVYGQTEMFQMDERGRKRQSEDRVPLFEAVETDGMLVQGSSQDGLVENVERTPNTTNGIETHYELHGG